MTTKTPAKRAAGGTKAKAETPNRGARLPKTILVGTDFSEWGDKAIRYATDLATLTKARVVLAHAFWAPEAVGIQDIEDARAMLERQARPLRDAGIDTETRVIEAGSPAKGVVTASKGEDADLIVVGSHGHRGLAHAVLGSVAEQIVKASKVAVLVVR